MFKLFHESGFECRALRMWHAPSTKMMTPGHASFDAALAKWPVRSVQSRMAGKNATFEYTVVEPKHFGHFIGLIERVDFNLWFAMPRTLARGSVEPGAPRKTSFWPF